MQANEHDYQCTTKCDSCGHTARGTMYHAESASGWVAPVLFLCKRCEFPKGRLDALRRRFLQWARSFYAQHIANRLPSICARH